MITELHIQNFKSHGNTLLPLKPLTILTGVNGSGKSSVLQSLLLLRQSYKKQRLNTALILNDSLCNIGIGKDAIYQSSEDDFLQFEIKTELAAYNWRFSTLENKDFLPALQEGINTHPDLSNVSLFNNNFQYLNAGRLPELKYGRGDLMVENERQISLKNGYGELVAQYLYHYGEKDVVKAALKNDNSKYDELIHQVTAWEREITPNVNVKPRKIGESFTIHYSFDRADIFGTTDDFKTENVAFGLTYALPVITAILSAKDDALLLIENPEAHLHPRGQSKLAELMALAAQNGIQMIVETHSDHIFNGIRKAIAAKKIDREKVKVHYLELDNTNTSVNTEIQFSDNGRILNHKKGLFDQFDDDLDELLGL
jgi:predicted ATPase